jgi:hypothetical protein
MREKTIEQYFINQVEKHGGEADKFVSPGKRGMPDRIIFVDDNGTVAFAEIKKPGEEPTELQYYRLRCLRHKGLKAEYLDSHEAVDQFIKEVFNVI